VKRFALIFGISLAAVGAVITLLTVITATWGFGLDQHGRAAQFWFSLGMTVMAPAMTIGDVLGIPYSASAWLWGLLAVTTNVVICFLIGTSVGVIARLIFRPTPKANEIVV
jgi:hypothetical protein